MSDYALLGKTAYYILHDIASDLTALRMNLELLNAQPQTDPEILEASTMSIEKIQELIKVARRQGQDESYIREFSLVDEVKLAFRLQAARLIKNNIRFQIYGKQSYKLKLDVIKFNQVILNLLVNAIEAFEASPYLLGTRNIRVEIKQEPNSFVILFKDNGPGIEKDVFRKIFEKGFSTKEKEDIKYRGAGLATVKNIVENDFGGAVKVRSQVNKGTCFEVEMPFVIPK